MNERELENLYVFMNARFKFDESHSNYPRSTYHKRRCGQLDTEFPLPVKGSKTTCLNPNSYLIQDLEKLYKLSCYRLCRSAVLQHFYLFSCHAVNDR